MKNALGFPPLKTLDGKTITVGKTYLAFNKYRKPQVVRLLCVSVNLGSRYWVAQRTDGSEERMKVKHVHQYGRHGVYSGMAAVKREQRRDLLEQIKRSKSYAADSRRRAAQYDRETSRLKRQLAKLN